MGNEQATPEGAKLRHFANVWPYHQQLAGFSFNNDHQQSGGLWAESDWRKYLKKRSFPILIQASNMCIYQNLDDFYFPICVCVIYSHDFYIIT